MSAILREGGSKKEKLKNTKNREEKKSYWVILLKGMMEWKLLEERVDRANGAGKNSVIVPQILG